jgi:hypothetical protein
MWPFRWPSWQMFWQIPRRRDGCIFDYVFGCTLPCTAKRGAALVSWRAGPLKRVQCLAQSLARSLAESCPMLNTKRNNICAGDVSIHLPDICQDGEQHCAKDDRGSCARGRQTVGRCSHAALAALASTLARGVAQPRNVRYRSASVSCIVPSPGC